MKNAILKLAGILFLLGVTIFAAKNVGMDNMTTMIGVMLVLIGVVIGLVVDKKDQD
jgi:hypothetical protein